MKPRASGQRGCGIKRLTIGGIIESRGLSLVRIMGVPDRPGIGGSLFQYLGKLGVNVEYISSASDVTGTANFVLGMSGEDGQTIARNPEDIRTAIDAQAIMIVPDVATIGIYGPHFRETPEIAAHLFCCLAAMDIQVLGVSTSISTVACLVMESVLEQAREAIQTAFALP